jgi:hypothetical protein
MVLRLLTLVLLLFVSQPSLSQQLHRRSTTEVRMASQRQDKDTYTLAEVMFETLVAARS